MRTPSVNISQWLWTHYYVINQRTTSFMVYSIAACNVGHNLWRIAACCKMSCNWFTNLVQVFEEAAVIISKWFFSCSSTYTGVGFENFAVHSLEKKENIWEIRSGGNIIDLSGMYSWYGLHVMQNCLHLSRVVASKFSVPGGFWRKTLRVWLICTKMAKLI